MTQKPDPSRAKSVSSVGVQLNQTRAMGKGSRASGKTTKVTKTTQSKVVAIAEVVDESAVTSEKEAKGWRIPLPSWHFLGILLILLSGGIGFLATSVLLSFNGSNNCSALYVPLASATTRLYCAQIEAEQQTLASYLKAIRMVNGFPDSHPLRPDIDRNIEAWVKDIIVLAGEEVQKGRLTEAIAMVKQVPEKAGFGALIGEQIAAWQGLWQEGEALMARLEQQLKAGELGQAMRTAVQLSYLENDYWATVKYDEAMAQIQLARKENRELEVAYGSLRRGGLENWLRAIEQASKIPESSYAYGQSQKLMDEARNNIIRYIQGIVDGQRWSELLSLCDRLPPRLNLDNMIVDWRILAQAGLRAKQGKVEDLETALVQIQSIQPSSVVYDQAQELSQRWQKAITDASLFEQAQSLAQGGTISELEQAIAKLNLVPEENPRYAEARQQARQWRSKIEALEDTPVLDYAKDLAASNRLEQIKQAIAEAQAIKPGRALYDEAQRNVRRWQASIERIEDQPIFDRAVALGRQNQFSEAIAVANQITADRALYRDMQAEVQEWRQALAAVNTLQTAYQTAASNSVSGWVEAIKLTQKIPSSATQLRAQGTQAANSWSFRILATAQSQANYSLPQAIATARQIPRYTAAYESAQAQIDLWESVLIPAIPNN